MVTETLQVVLHDVRLALAPLGVPWARSFAYDGFGFAPPTAESATAISDIGLLYLGPAGVITEVFF